MAIQPTFDPETGKMTFPQPSAPREPRAGTLPRRTTGEASKNTFYHGDCLFIMNRDIAPESIDLIYLDPPFFTGKVQKGKWEPGKMEVSFEDSRRFWGDTERVRTMRTKAPGWLTYIAEKRPDFASYLYYLMVRLAACKRVLKSTGSIYLHCDYRASHYLKMVMDEIFGADNFRNEVVWCYTGPGSPGMKQFMRKHDAILYYSKGREWTFHPEKLPYKDGAPHTGGFGHDLDIDRVEFYAELGGKIPEDWWSDIAIAVRSSKERVGYPTQKPLKLLERIILASSNEGDIVLDPFCGCGTTVVAAHKLNRRWIGTDISNDAREVVVRRGEKETQMSLGMASEFAAANYVSRDLGEVKGLNPNEFERWVNEFYGAYHPSPDAGVDGITRDGVPIQTKTDRPDDKVVRRLYGDALQHPSVPKPIKQIVLVSQIGFDDSARRKEYEIETEFGIEVELKVPEDLLKIEEIIN